LVRFIQDNKAEVERDLIGIAAVIVVIKRSGSLSQEKRGILTAIEGEQPRLAILIHYDLVRRARAELERLRGLRKRAECEYACLPV